MVLGWAAKCAHLPGVALLVQREDINPNIKDTEYDQTPLTLVEMSGYRKVVKFLR